MDKRSAIQIMTRAAALYHENLEDQKVNFLYGVPAEVKRQIQAESGQLPQYTLLQKDIRDVTASPVQKVYAVFSKGYTAERHSVLEKLDKGIDISKVTVARTLTELVKCEYIAKVGSGPSTAYVLI